MLTTRLLLPCQERTDFRISEVEFTEFLDNSSSLFLLKCYLTQSNRLQCPKINQTVSCSQWVKEGQWQTPMNARVTVRWYVHLVTGVTVCVSTLALQVVTGTSAHVQGLGHTLQSSCTLQVPCEVKILLDSCSFVLVFLGMKTITVKRLCSPIVSFHNTGGFVPHICAAVPFTRS